MLDDSGVSYQLVEHAPVYTSEQASEIRKMPQSVGAKALVCIADKQVILIVVSGDKKVDFKEFKKAFRVKNLCLMTPERVTELTTLEVGSIPPTGKILDLPSYYDEVIKDSDTVAFNAGSHTHSIIMNTLDLLRLEEPILGNFACSAN